MNIAKTILGNQNSTSSIQNGLVEIVSFGNGRARLRNGEQAFAQVLNEAPKILLNDQKYPLDLLIGMNKPYEANAYRVSEAKTIYMEPKTWFDAFFDPAGNNLDIYSIQYYKINEVKK